MIGMLLIAFLASSIAAAAPDWSEGAAIPSVGRGNIYLLSEQAWRARIQAGRLHAQIYPVAPTGMLPPLRPIQRVIDGDSRNPLKVMFHEMLAERSGIEDFVGLLHWMGLPDYPKAEDQGVYQVPYPGGMRPDMPMGFALVQSSRGTGFTLSCAECHAGRLFGKTVLGLSNRFERGNRSFHLVKQLSHQVLPGTFALYAGASYGETQMYRELRENLRAVGVQEPLALGLDTSLAQVALSLQRRSQDEWATRSWRAEASPREDLLQHQPADSKPMVWWNVKYKNRWLSDGSVVSGNPVFTNFLWNEIGRGADLRQVRNWLVENPNIVEELTAAVFASEAPRFTDFFSAASVDLAQAQRGENIFQQRCQHCHGEYVKAWSQNVALASDAFSAAAADSLATIEVRYFAQTPVIDVGTDPLRALGMQSLAEKLNPLAFSKEFAIKIRPQQGYVPPPLVGIWARWPYFHNNSAPSLCAVLTPAAERPQRYAARAAEDPARDFDRQCNGYPETMENAVEIYVTDKPGQQAIGHDQGIFVQNGKNLLSPQDRADLIVFLQTL